MEQSFVTFDREALRITVRFSGKPELVIDQSSVEISYFSGGPGGQNVNKNMSGVRLIYRIPEGYRMGALKTRELIAKTMNQRQRERNLVEAFGILAEKLRDYFYVKPYRKPTRTPRRAKEKRLGGKKIRGNVKRNRKIGNFDL